MKQLLMLVAAGSLCALAWAGGAMPEAAAGALGAAQPGGEAQGNANPVRAEAPARAQRGYLILDGALVEKPYHVSIEKDHIVINGVHLTAEARPGAPFAVTREAEARHELNERFLEWAKIMVRTQEGAAAARAAADYLRIQPLVERAEPGSDGTHVMVWLRGVRDREEWMLPRRGPRITPEEARRQYLESEVRALEFWLRTGSVVIIQNGVILATHASEGELLLQRLEEAVTVNVADATARYLAVKRFINDDTLAMGIAENFRPRAR